MNATMLCGIALVTVLAFVGIMLTSSRWAAYWIAVAQANAIHVVIKVFG